MADRKITDLTALAAGSQATGDLLTIVDVSESAAADKNKKITTENFFKGIPGDVGIGTSSPRALVDFGPGSGDGTLSNTLSEYQAVFEAPQGTGDVSRNIAFAVTTGGICAAINAVDEGGSNATGLIFATGNAGNIVERLRIDENGNVGIGTTSPSSYGSAVKLAAASSGNTAISIASGTSDDGTLFFADGTSGDATYRGSVKYLHSSDAMQFSTAASEQMRIDSSGQVGIGTSSPSAPLTVFGGSASSPTIRIEGGSSGTDNARIESEYNLVLACNGDGDQSDRKIQFRNNATDLVTIDASGNLGIGTTTPGSVTGSGIDLERSGPACLRLNDTSGNGAVVEIYSDDGEMSAVYDSRGNSANHGHQFRINGSEKLRINSSGKVVVGHSSSTDVAAIQSQLQVVGADAATGSIAIRRDQDVASGPLLVFGKSRGSRGGNTAVQDGDQLGVILFNGADGTDLAHGAARIKAEIDGSPGSNDMPGRILFETTADGTASLTERLRIDSAGAITTDNSAYAFLRSDSTTVTSLTLRKDASGADGVDYFQCRNTANDLKLVIEGDGDVKNANNSYGQTSDRKLKENIVDASSQWSDIKNLQVRNFNFTEVSGYPTHTQIGLVAQEVETVSPGLVSESIDRDEESNDLGTTTKGVKYSVLYMKAVKALQEAMDRIETLEAKVAALEAQ